MDVTTAAERMRVVRAHERRDAARSAAREIAAAYVVEDIVESLYEADLSLGALNRLSQALRRPATHVGRKSLVTARQAKVMEVLTRRWQSSQQVAEAAGITTQAAGSLLNGLHMRRQVEKRRDHGSVNTAWWRLGEGR
jgi:hypothetical protein